MMARFIRSDGTSSVVPADEVQIAGDELRWGDKTLYAVVRDKHWGVYALPSCPTFTCMRRGNDRISTTSEFIEIGNNPVKSNLDILVCNSLIDAVPPQIDVDVDSDDNDTSAERDDDLVLSSENEGSDNEASDDDDDDFVEFADTNNNDDDEDDMDDAEDVDDNDEDNDDDGNEGSDINDDSV